MYAHHQSALPLLYCAQAAQHCHMTVPSSSSVLDIGSPALGDGLVSLDACPKFYWCHRVVLGWLDTAGLHECHATDSQSRAKHGPWGQQPASPKRRDPDK